MSEKTLISRWDELDDFTPRALYALLKLRVDIFVVEQECPYPEIDGKDIGAYHLRILDGDELAAALRVLPPESEGKPAKIGRVVVAPDYRGYQLGRRLMQEAIAFRKSAFPASPSNWVARVICRNSMARLVSKRFRTNIWKTASRMWTCGCNGKERATNVPAAPPYVLLSCGYRRRGSLYRLLASEKPACAGHWRKHILRALSGAHFDSHAEAHGGISQKHAASTDEPAWIIFLVTFATVIVAVVSLFIVVNRHPQADSFTLVTTLASVPLGWATIHMLTAIHYAHAYWQPRDPAGDDSSHASRYRGGFDFPGTPEPSGWDFAYYAYVIGMTAQTSDTSVTTTTMRRLTLMHSVVSYFFNTILVAAAVNAAVALGS